MGSRDHPARTGEAPLPTAIPPAFAAGPVALVVAHPGHEVRVLRFCELVRPTVFVLTDGAGASGPGRLDGSRALLARLGAPLGSVFGRFTDRALYAAILAARSPVFVALQEELGRAFLDLGARHVVADRRDGYNPAHDLCHLLASGARRLARARGGPPLTLHDFPLVGAPGGGAGRGRPVRIRLDPAALERKLAAARAFPGLAEETEQALAAHGAPAFAEEVLWPVPSAAAPRSAEPPGYEAYGEAQVRAGRYTDVIREALHMDPLRTALADAVGQAMAASATGPVRARG